MSHAKTAANWYACIGTDEAHASIYDDGALIYLKVSKDQQDMIAEQMGKSIIDSARSSERLLWCHHCAIRRHGQFHRSCRLVSPAEVHCLPTVG